MYYQNRAAYDNAEVAFYEIFCRYTGNGRDHGVTSDYIIGTADSVPEAEDLCFDLNAQSAVVIEKSKGYKNLWEDIILLDGRPARRSTCKWTDEFGFQDALAEFRKIDPTFHIAENPKYMYRAVHRLAKVKIPLDVYISPNAITGHKETENDF